MNAARMRRPLIKKRARKALMKQLKHGPQVVLERIAKPPAYVLSKNKGDMRWARIYLKVDSTFEPHFITSVWMQLPIENTGATISKMQKNGFWTVRPDKNQMAFIMPDQIRQVIMNMEEK